MRNVRSSSDAGEGNSLKPLPAVLLALATFLAYSPVLRAGFIWDDDALTENPLMRSAAGLWSIWVHPSANPREAHYWPLVYTCFWIEHALWGLHPIGYHLVNVALHLASSLLLWRLLDRIGARGAALAAAIFALHPVHVESVAWVVELKDVLSTLFYLLAFLSFIQFERENDWIRCGACLIFFICAMLSKAIAVTLPVAMGMWLWWERSNQSRFSHFGSEISDAKSRKRNNIKNVTLNSSFSADPAFWTVLLVVGIAALIAVLDYALVRSLTAKEPEEYGLSMIGRSCVAGRALWFYILKLLWPANLMAVYPRWTIASSAFHSLAFPLVAILVLCILAHFRRRVGATSTAGIRFFILTLAPTLGFVGFKFFTYSFVADRFEYLASAGLIVLFSAGAAMIPRRLGLHRNPMIQIAAASLLVPLGVSTWRQTEIYKSMETHSRDNLRLNPSAWVAHNNLGVVLVKQKRYDEAIEHHREALRLMPAAEHHYTLAYSLDMKGNAEEAKAHYLEALRLNPAHAAAHNNLGNLLDDQGLLEEATEHYRAAITFRPDYPEAHNNLGTALARGGKTDEAIREFQKALELKPDYEEAKENLQKALDESR